jgi:hypothetical protein|tara:strand:+ start:10588 stop:11286 length:699 start_codon:yes stop_codon:yes gene_type:complete
MADKPKAIPFMIGQVEARWPRLNTTYRFDNKEKRSVPCDVFDDGAKYEVSFRMSGAQAKKLFSEMKAAYTAKSVDGWPDKFDNPFTKEEGGTYTFKASLKGAYGKDATRKPVQYDATNVKLPDDFMLTTGSTINIAGVYVPYHASMGTGVSLRLNAVQVTNYVPTQMSSPFEATEGFEAEGGNPFAVVDEPDIDPVEVEKTEETEEPKKVNKKDSAGGGTDPDLDAIMDAWD